MQITLPRNFIKEYKMLLKKSGGYEARDPSVIYHNKKYYHCFTINAEAIYIAKASTLKKLAKAKPILVYKPEENKDYSKELWAPELHVINDKCYIYVACDDGNNRNHRMYVLTNDNPCPTKPYHMLTKLTDETNRWAIDGTVFTYKNQLYTIWSGWEADRNDNQNLYIAKMENPFTINSQRVKISTPEYDWEKKDAIGDGIKWPPINEGAFAYEKDGKLRVIYSASGSWANHYCMGILEFEGDDLLNTKNWKKQPFPALSLEDGWNGPGHCSIFSNGENDYIAFHVYDEGKTSGWDNVHAVVSPFKIENGKIILLDK